MKTFTCDSCGSTAYFENVRCTKCESTLAYLPLRNELAAIEADADGVFKGADGTSYRLCQNSLEHNVCNEAVLLDSDSPYCRSCELTEAVPDLHTLENRELWYQLEMHKRRLIFSLRTLGLMPSSKKADPEKGLAFRFLDDEGGKVMTGHDDGVITITLAEADDAEREKRRKDLGEPYRSLIGHFRHEVGHYYWDRLVMDDGPIEEFRAMFGDERADYGKALKAHYAKADDGAWREHCISHYAAAHPWEDWAESFSHYLLARDLTETAISVGLLPNTLTVGEMHFDDLLESWIKVVLQVNELGKSSGAGTLYPFVPNETVREKLRFIDGLVRPDVEK